MATGNELVTFDMMKYMHEKLKEEIDTLASVMSVTSWKDVQKAVRSGIASKIFSIGDQLTCQRDNDTLVWDIIGIDHDTPADPQFTHSLTLQLHDCFPTTMQFDAPEAFYYAENGLAAGTYHFTIDSTDYQFTLASGVAAGGQLILTFSNNVPSSISVAQIKGGAVTESSIVVTTGSGGTALDSNYINDFGKAQNGSNNYKESAIRQWLNSSAAAESVWTPQTNFDRPPKWHTGEGGTTKQAGFMNGMDADFLAVIGNVTKVTAVQGNNTTDTTDRFFLLSRSEAFARNIVGLNEGTPYPYYADYSDYNTANEGADSNRIKRVSGSAAFWWCRSPQTIDPRNVRGFLNNGRLGENSANGNGGVCAACNII